MRQKRQFVEPVLHEEAALAVLTQTLVSGGGETSQTQAPECNWLYRYFGWC